MLIVILHILLVTLVIIRILLRDTLSPTTRLGWLVIITFLPLVGVGAYFLFGEINLGRTKIKQAEDIKVETLALTKKLFHSHSLLNNIVPWQYQPAFHYASSINHFPLTYGNHVELMSDGKTARQRLVDDINHATDSVYALYYIWLNDTTGQNVANALINAAKRGVKCKVMADALGSRAIVKSALWQQMKQAGVQAEVVLPFKRLIRTLIFSRLDLRNHRKITVIDGYITHCGSQNCADQEFLVKAKYAPWVDIMLRIKGPVATQNSILFANDWLLHSQDNRIDELNIHHCLSDGKVAAQILGDGPTERAMATPQLFASLIHTAQHSLIISTPYFVPDATVLEALCSAAHRGVAVTLIFPENNDSKIVAAASRSYYAKLLQAGIDIHEFKGGLLHSKTLTIDGAVCLMGSSNMDIRSFDLNYENDILIYDHAVTGRVIDRQKEYMASSVLVSVESIQAWSRRKRIWNNLLATIGPVL